jgi:hypothetical protein
MAVIDGGMSYKYGAYLADKSDSSTIPAFDQFQVTAKSLSGGKIRCLRTDRAFDSMAWAEYCCEHGIVHEFTAPHSSAQNGLAEHAIRTTMDDVHTLLHDSGLGHLYWAEAAAYSIATRNIVLSRRHPGKVPLESLTGKRQSVSHLRVFGAKCWAKIPTVNSALVTGGSKLDPRSTECRLLGYAGGNGNYRVQAVPSRHVFVSRDVIFEEGQPHCTSPSVGETTDLFDVIFDVTGEDNIPNNDPLDDGKALQTPNDPVSQADQQVTDRTFPPDRQSDNVRQDTTSDMPVIRHHGDTPMEPLRQAQEPR